MPDEKEWLKVFPEEAQKDKDFGTYTSPEEVYKGWKNQRETISKKGVILPTAGAPPEEVEKFFNTIGRPEKPEGYKLKVPEKLHAGVQIGPEFETAFRQSIHKRGLTQEQAAGVYEEFATMLSTSLSMRDEESKKAVEKTQTDLRNKWGKDYDAKAAMAQKTVEKLYGEDGKGVWEKVKASGSDVEVFANIGSMVSEDQINAFVKGGGAGGGNVELDQKQSEDKIKEILAGKDPEFTKALMNQSDPKNEEAVKKWNDLHKKAYGGTNA